MTTAWRPRGRPPHPDVLTRTEWTIFLRVRDGFTNAEIALRRGCREDTVKYHVANIVAKLELPDRAALRRWNGYPLPGEELRGVDLRALEEKARMQTRTAPGTVTGVAPMFLVDDVARTAEWYRDHLGFAIGEYFREDHGAEHSHDGGAPHTHPHPNGLGQPVFVILSRDGHRLMLG
jgi:DNA-binding CsgD family transcriptional regulator